MSSITRPLELSREDAERLREFLLNEGDSLQAEYDDPQGEWYRDTGVREWMNWARWMAARIEAECL